MAKHCARVIAAGHHRSYWPTDQRALLLNSHPELHTKIARIVTFGGGNGIGNWTPAAEFTYVDPEAAEIRFQSGIPVVMAGWTSPIRRRFTPPISMLPRHRQLPLTIAELLDFFFVSSQRRKWDLSARRCMTRAPRPAAETRDFHYR